VDSLYADPNGVRLLKSLCQTETRKRVAWESQTTAMNHDGPPSEFFTESNVLIIANEWKTLNKNVLAIQDRGHVNFFDPDPVEVHVRVSQWFRDQEVYDFVADCLRRNLIGRPTMRMYVKAL